MTPRETRSSRPCVLDFEASSLNMEPGGSYPIEIAYSLPDGSIEAHLIRPEADWVDWSDYAEEHIHGISRALLAEAGRPAVWVAARMNEVLAGLTLLSDAPAFDGFWLERLFAAAGLEPAFELGNFNTELLYAQAADPDSASARIARAQELARASVPNRHRAASDVRYLLEVWEHARPAHLSPRSG